VSAGVHPHDDLAVYAVDALPPDERTAVEAHVAACGVCQDELAAHRETLSWVIEDEQPPPWLWDQIGADARAVRPGPAPATGVDARAPAAGYAEPRHLRRRPSRGVLAGLAAAAAVVVALVLGPVIADRVSDDDGTEVVADDLPVGAIEGDDGAVIARVEADSAGSFVRFEDAPELAAARAYQLWSLDGPTPVSLGVLGTGTGQEVRVSLPAGTTQVAISDEPAAGSPQPTGDIVGRGQLALPS
jgi:anti-sigma-K factor RskA